VNEDSSGDVIALKHQIRLLKVISVISCLQHKIYASILGD
jgi:hypothetical protein